FFCHDPSPTDIYTLSLHDALPIWHWMSALPLSSGARLRSEWAVLPPALRLKDASASPLVSAAATPPCGAALPPVSPAAAAPQDFEKSSAEPLQAGCQRLFGHDWTPISLDEIKIPILRQRKLAMRHSCPTCTLG